jgi:thioredoxin-dependent peroxiredoxin
MELKIGSKAPEFSLPDQNNKIHNLADYKGKWVLLYFYPKDDTEGCTKEACAIRDNFPKFKNIQAEVLGISADSVASHKKFEQKYGLPFTLLADAEKKAITAYGAWGEKNMMGRKYQGILRTSFLINPKGEIAKIYEAVKPNIHAEEVLKDLNKMIK